MKNNFNTVTIIGANGTMGRNIAAIFASFGNATVYLVSRSMDKSIVAKNKAYMSVRAESIKEKMIPSDYEHLEECVKKSELIFEACAETWEVKETVHKRIAAVLDDIDYGVASPEKKVFCSGTSGLSITKLAEFYPVKYRHQFMGMHFFNPPYQMTLCEMTPTKYTERDRSAFVAVKEYADLILHRTVVETADTPAFLGNRIGFQFINDALQVAEKYKYNGGIDYVDSIIGSFTGRSMPPLVTANFVGLDVHKAIVENIYNNTEDYAHDTFKLPEFVKELIDGGRIGRKAGEGFYKTVIHDSGTKIHQVYDIAHGCYREKIKYTFPYVEEMLAFLQVGEYESAFYTLVENKSMEAKLCCEFLLKYIVYSLNTSKMVGCKIGAADDVMATGFHWCPPLAMMEAISAVTNFENLCEERLEPQIVAILKTQRLLEGIDKSRYDFRRFMLAKR